MAGTLIDTTGTKWEESQEVWIDEEGWVIFEVRNNGTVRYASDSYDTRMIFRGLTVLPDGAQGQNDNGGFTSTGLDRIGRTGKWAGCNLVGNDGRQSTSSGTFFCSLVILSPDFERIVYEIPCNTPDFPGIESIQGVAWDSSDDTYWFVDKTNEVIRHVTNTGVKLLDEITWTDPTWPPNGLAYIPEEDAIIVTAEGGTTNYARVYSCATGLETRQVPLRGSLDHIDWDDGLIFGTFGGNAEDGSIEVYNGTTGEVLVLFSGLEYAQAIEGIYREGDRIWCVNDGAFHDTAKPPLALALEWELILDERIQA